MTTASKIKVKNGSTFQSLLDICYPVGSIYQSTKATNPGTFLGGTWRSLSDRFLIGAGAKAAGATGGEESHTLTVSEMPSHTHKWLVGGKERIAYGISGSAGSFVDGLALGTGSAISITSTGGGLRTTICRPTSSCTCGSAQHRGDSLCSLRSRAEARTKRIARSLSEGSTSAPSTARRRVYGPVRHGSASHPGRSLPQAEARRQAITLSARREGRRASCFPLTKSPTINTPFLTATIREAVRNSVSISSTGLTCFGLIRSLVTLVADNLMRTGRRTSPSICGKELNKEVAAWRPPLA